MSLKDYTRKDITEIRQYLVDLIEKIDTTGKWTDRNESDLGMVYLELAAGVADMMNFYIDKQALENYLPTVTQRKNLKRILALIGYKMKSPVSATCLARVDLTRPLNVDVTIPKYFQLSYMRDEGSIYYATAEDVDILAGDTYASLRLIQGVVNEINLTVADLMENRTVTIRDDKVAFGSVEVKIGDTLWTEVPDVLIDEKHGTKYSVTEDNDDFSRIEFGYYWQDFLPADYRTPVTIRYLQTAGSLGAVKAGLITNVEQDLNIINSNGNQENIKSLLVVRNTEDASGGADRETMDEARLKAPQLVKSRQLMTTLVDYEAMAESQPGVYLAQAIDWTVANSEYVGVPYTVDLYIIPTDENEYVASAALREQIEEALHPYLWSSIDLSVLAAPIVDIDIVAEVYTSSNAENWPGLRREVEDMFRDFFQKKNCTFNATYTRGQLENVVTSMSDMIDFIEILEPESTIRLNPMEFPRLNKLDIYVRATDLFNDDRSHVDFGI